MLIIVNRSRRIFTFERHKSGLHIQNLEYIGIEMRFIVTSLQIRGLKV